MNKKSRRVGIAQSGLGDIREARGQNDIEQIQLCFFFLIAGFERI